MVLEAGYPGTTGFRKVVKATGIFSQFLCRCPLAQTWNSQATNISVLVKKKEGISDEDFIQHYNHVHARMAAPVLQKHKIIHYSLVSDKNPLIDFPMWSFHATDHIIPLQCLYRLISALRTGLADVPSPTGQKDNARHSQRQRPAPRL